MPIAARPPLTTRIALTALGVLASVVVPFFLQQQFNDAALDASRRVTRSLQVESRAQAVIADARNFEAAALGLALGVDTPVARARLADAFENTPIHLNQLQDLAESDAEKLLRVARLRDRVETRLQWAKAAASATDPEQRRQYAVRLAAQSPIRDLAVQIITAEQEHIALRQRSAQKALARAQLVSYAAMALQIAVLLGLLAFWHRENERRLVIERRQRQVAEQATVMLDAMRDPVALLDPQLRVLQANSSFASAYAGDANAPPIAQPLAEVGNGAWKDPVLLQRLGEVVTRGRELWDYEFTRTGAAGQKTYMLVNAIRVADEATGKPQVLLIGTDFTARRISEDQVLQLNRQLEGKVEQVSEVNRELEAFSYSVSHDLRAPLRHIAGFADKLGRHLGDDADAKAQHYLTVISTSAQRMGTLIDDLLVYSRLGRHAMRLQPVDTQSLVQEIRSMLDEARSAEPDAERVQWHIAPLPVVIADGNMLRQVWQNLLGNAVKYSGHRRPPVVSVRHERNAEGDHVFTVEDNGAGFDMAHATKLFGVFQRLHKASEFPGTGVGLASVRRVVSRHGGQVWAEAEPDKGARFHFTLPHTPDAPGRAMPKDSA
ncbi:ATP-binding protein [Lysobacter korlensis]|uniref:histidine kinase n=1 Tax=Lysobacter korlensis TaxID=553636 RepID=A0ABV6RSJ5_9GAMM